MKRFYHLIFGLLLFIVVVPSRADEGMWLPLFVDRLNHTDMQKMGLQLTAEEIYSINNSSLKDAIVIFGGGCTGEVVSNQGLVFTNHHCGYPSIAALSSPSMDILTNGFYANTLQEELTSPTGLAIKFLVRIENVTDRILRQIPFDATEKDREAAVTKAMREIEATASAGNSFEATVKAFYHGNEYYLFVYEVYQDVRLVMAPPSAIGKFGGDTDNWMWPRHTGDFSVFRVYTSPDGKPAPYNKNNIPLKPKKFLPISLAGVKEGDFAMIMGYPGRTNRYMSSFGVNMAYSFVNPAIIKIREKKLTIMAKDMANSDAVRIQYASKYATIANYYKYYIGQNKGILRLKVIERKREMEDDFETWVNNDNIPKMGYYKDALIQIENSYRQLLRYAIVRTYLSETLLRGSDIIPFAYKFNNIFKELSAEKPNLNTIYEETQKLSKEAEKYWDMNNMATEKILFQEMLKIYHADVPVDFHPQFFSEIERKFNNDFRVYTDYVFQVSIFTSKDKLEKFLEKPTLKALQDDPVFQIAQQVFDLNSRIKQEIAPIEYQLEQGNRKYIQGLREMYPNRSFYPDANSTMRLTYGKVLSYAGSDAVDYSFFTTLDGVMEKENPNSDEFIVPEKLKDLWKKKDYGQYGENGKLITCFLTNNDITGGNSGSPVLNAKGELIGLAFDANWEAMSGDIVFEPKLQRCICVDIRYVLFVMEKYAGASRLIEELDLRK